MWNREILLRFDPEEMIIFRIFLKSLDFDFGKYNFSKSLTIRQKCRQKVIEYKYMAVQSVLRLRSIIH